MYDVINLFQCPNAVPYLSFCPDDEAERIAKVACDKMLADSFSSCLDEVGPLFLYDSQSENNTSVLQLSKYILL